MATDPTQQVPLSMYVEQRLKDELEELSRRNERSVSAEMRVALRAHVMVAYEQGLLTEVATA